MEDILGLWSMYGSYLKNPFSQGRWDDLGTQSPFRTLKPSQADIALTQKIVKAAKAIDITVLDHLIVTEKSTLALQINTCCSPWIHCSFTV